MNATETEDRIVGKKNSARSATEARLFRTNISANSSDSTVWPMTTVSMNLNELPTALAKTLSLVSRFV